MTWQRESENGCQTIDTTLSKYKETKENTNEPKLIIKDCDKSDGGSYFLLAGCTDTIGYLISNKIDLNIVEGKKQRFIINIKQIQIRIDYCQLYQSMF